MTLHATVIEVLEAVPIGCEAAEPARQIHARIGRWSPFTVNHMLHNLQRQGLICSVREDQPSGFRWRYYRNPETANG